MSYGSDCLDSYRMAGDYTGESPAELPVVQATMHCSSVPSMISRVRGTLLVPTWLDRIQPSAAPAGKRSGERCHRAPNLEAAVPW